MHFSGMRMRLQLNELNTIREKVKIVYRLHQRLDIYQVRLHGSHVQVWKPEQ